MAFQKGQPRPDNAGRKKGSINKTTKDVRDIIQQVYLDNISNLQADLDRMNPFQRQQILDKLAAKFLPSLTKSENDNTHSGEIEIVVSYKNSGDMSED